MSQRAGMHVCSQWTTRCRRATSSAYSECTFWPNCRCPWVSCTRQQCSVRAGGKHIYTVRDPYDTLISHYNFIVPVTNISLDNISLDDYYYRYYASVIQPTYWKNLASWLKHRYFAEGFGNTHLLLFYCFQPLTHTNRAVLQRR